MNANPPKAAQGVGWHAEAAARWTAGDQHGAMTLLLADLNRHGHHKPTPRVMQLVYYMFQRGDWAAAAGCLTLQHATDPASDQVLLNLAACLSRAGRTQEAVDRARDYVARHDDEPLAWDVLSSGLYTLGQLADAAEAGTRSLVLKDRLSVAAHRAAGGTTAAALPSKPHDAVATQDVIAFSLWGAQPRYLWGALDNLLAARSLFPGWQPRIYLDDTVPAAWQAAFVELGAVLQPQPRGQTLRQRLCWRFHVANDPAVRRFLVRDIDSVLNPRDHAAVAAWLASGRRFHAMRDWWTHTDLILAGMWGGTAGVLPSIEALLDQYRPRAMETPNVDQWFLRDCVWPLLRDDCLVHDRCFHPPGRQPWPVPAPAGNLHVGQNEHATRLPEQRARIQAWLSRLPPL
jgi:tetratricopeptide (TPR) repeat protein